MRDPRESRPVVRAAGISAANLDNASMPLTRDQRAQLVMRVAWLRVHADELIAVDPSGQLSAQLRDFADLLEWRWDR